MISVSSVAQHPNGQSIDLYTLSLPSGPSVAILTYGGIVRSLRVPDKMGKLREVTLGLERIEDYFGRHPYLGATVGRIAGRVPNGTISLDGQIYHLSRNEGSHHLHGGYFGLDRRIWQAEAIDNKEAGAELRLSYSSPHLEEGYPGNVAIKVIYKLYSPCVFSIETEATTDRATPLCLAHHSYFNLGGDESNDALDHRVAIQADGIAEVDSTLIPTGERTRCQEHPSDLRRPAVLRQAIPQFARRNGELYFLHPPFSAHPASVVQVAQLYLEKTGIQLDVSTDEACLQFYTGSELNGEWRGRQGAPINAFAGVCFECQGYPGATTQRDWGDIIVRPDRPQRRQTQYAFTVKD